MIQIKANSAAAAAILNSPLRCESFRARLLPERQSVSGIYPSYIEQVRPEFNGLFREEDYPSAKSSGQSSA